MNTMDNKIMAYQTLNRYSWSVLVTAKTASIRQKDHPAEVAVIHLIEVETAKPN